MEKAPEFKLVKPFSVWLYEMEEIVLHNKRMYRSPYFKKWKQRGVYLTREAAAVALEKLNFYDSAWIMVRNEETAEVVYGPELVTKPGRGSTHCPACDRKLEGPYIPPIEI